MPTAADAHSNCKTAFRLPQSLLLLLLLLLLV
jgi:hypothetical protein